MTLLLPFVAIWIMLLVQQLSVGSSTSKASVEIVKKSSMKCASFEIALPRI